MNQKVIILLVVCIAVVLAAGCTGIPGGKSDSLSFPQNTGPVSDSNGRLQADSKMAYGENAVSGACKRPDGFWFR